MNKIIITNLIRNFEGFAFLKHTNMDIDKIVNITNSKEYFLNYIKGRLCMPDGKSFITKSFLQDCEMFLIRSENFLEDIVYQCKELDLFYYMENLPHLNKELQNIKNVFLKIEKNYIPNEFIVARVQAGFNNKAFTDYFINDIDWFLVSENIFNMRFVSYDNVLNHIKWDVVSASIDFTENLSTFGAIEIVNDKIKWYTYETDVNIIEKYDNFLIHFNRYIHMLDWNIVSMRLHKFDKFPQLFNFFENKINKNIIKINIKIELKNPNLCDKFKNILIKNLYAIE